MPVRSLSVTSHRLGIRSRRRAGPSDVRFNLTAPGPGGAEPDSAPGPGRAAEPDAESPSVYVPPASQLPRLATGLARKL